MNQADVVSPLVVNHLRSLPKGMTESDHLSQAYLTQSTVMDRVVSFAMGSQNESVISQLTSGIGNTKSIDNREYTWYLNGQNDKVVTVSRTSPDAAGGQPGRGRTSIKLYFAERLFERTDVILADDQTQLRVQEEAYRDGEDWVYKCILMSNKPFLDPAMITLGAQFSKDYSLVEEASYRGGGTDFEAPMRLVNQLGTLRKNYECTRSAATDVMVITLTAKNGQKTNMWTKLAEWNFIKQWYQEVDRYLMFGEISKDYDGRERVAGSNGRPVYSGAGIRQQISASNIRYYSSLTYELLEGFLQDLSFTAQKWGGDTNFVALTGLMGLGEFNKAIVDRQKALGITVTDSGTFISGSGENLELKGHFTKVTFIGGISLTVRRFHPYDDLQRNRILHPVSGRPVESYRFTILNFGTTADGGANIYKLAKKDSEDITNYVCGTITPDGKPAGNRSASNFDGYEMSKLAEIGICMENPAAAGELIYSVD